MATYTGVADANGDFTVSFSSNYTAGQKVSITAEKDGASKSIELYAPSETIGGGVLKFSGGLEDFPANVGVLTIEDEIKNLSPYCFYSAGSSGYTFANSVTGIYALGVEHIGDYAFYGFTACESLNLRDILTIGESAFQNCSMLTTLELGSQLISIGANAFSSCSNITSITMPDTVTSMGVYAFDSCISLATVHISTSLTMLPARAFIYCGSINDLTIPPSITSMGDYALGGLSSLVALRLSRPIPPTITTDTLYQLPSTCKIYVPTANLAAYKAAANWKVHASKMIGV